ncbi:hypothetical protein D3C71_1591690 [compost metagenome]
MTAGCDQRHAWIFQFADQTACINMPRNMMRANQRLVPGQRQALRRHNADQKRADKTRPLCNGNGVQFLRRNSRLLQRFLHNKGNDLHMLARRNLRHNSAESAMCFNLARDDIRQHLAAVLDDRRRCLVAAGLDSQYIDRLVSARLILHSSPTLPSFIP